MARKAKIKFTNTVFDFSGMISFGLVNADSFEHIFLEQENGYKIDLLGRMTEASHNFGIISGIRYWIGPERTTQDDLITKNLEKLDGNVWFEYNAYEYSYSEWTHGTEYDTIFTVGNHDLKKELKEKQGSFLYLQATFLRLDNSNFTYDN